jgi:hypothetical protein
VADFFKLFGHESANKCFDGGPSGSIVHLGIVGRNERSDHFDEAPVVVIDEIVKVKYLANSVDSNPADAEDVVVV